MSESRGIQSIEVGGTLLLALAHLGRPAPLKDLAREAGMVPAKAHPYLVSFGKIGLIQQDPGTGYYGLGPLALQLGLISLQQVDPIRLATADLPRLAQAVGHTVGVAIWGNRGPTFVRLEDGPTAVHVHMRHGTVVAIRGTASGRLFAAFMPREQVLHALELEGEDPHISQRFEAELRRIRERRFASITDGTVKGVSALAAPVVDGFGKMVLAITAIGPSASLDVDEEGPAAKELVKYAQGISAQLGALNP
ncbi:MAG: IclR family transcriptional regulator [Burkholderiales bacterium]|nr:IclR family transcriptional regulator [Burkholderiales bacterium]